MTEINKRITHGSRLVQKVLINVLLQPLIVSSSVDFMVLIASVTGAMG